MKKIIIGCLAVLGILVITGSCSEKVLLMPENQEEDSLETLNTRPPLRPNTVSVYADFYYALEIVFPEEQPERVAKAEIEWDKTLNSWEKFEVTDFDAIVRLENLESREYTVKVTYISATGQASKTAVLKQTPLQELYKYVEQSIKVEGKDGLILVDWKNNTKREVRIDVRYTAGGQEQLVSKLSAKDLDTVIIEDLTKGNYDFHVSVFDPVKEARSNEVTVTADPGETVPAIVLGTWGTVSFAPSKHAGISFQNPSAIIPVTVKIDYEKDDGTMDIKLYENVLNQKILDVLTDVKLGSSMQITVTDSKGSKTQTEQISTTGVSPNTELNRTGWVGAASSSRTGQTGLNQLLDGLGGSNGWQSNHGYANNPPADPADPITGTPSNRFPHYIQMDMLDVKFVTGVSFVNHSNGVQNGPGEFIVQYSFDGQVFHNAQTMQRPFGNTANGNGANARTHHYLDQPLTARYIRIFIVSGDNGNPSDGVVRIAEFYVYGTE